MRAAVGERLVNAEECARLVSLVRSLYPAQRFDENPRNVVDAWGFVVADVDFEEARAAVVRLARRGVQWVSPGDVRREAAHSRNVLAPDVDQLVRDCREVARLQGVGRRSLHPAALSAYDTIGGAETIKRLDAYGLGRLRSMIADAAASFDRRVLDEQLPQRREPYSLDTTERKMTELEGPSVEARPMPEQLRKMIDEGGKRP